MGNEGELTIALLRTPPQDHLPIMTGFGFSHQPLVNMFGSGITSFFRKIEVYGSENVPEEGPIIL